MKYPILLISIIACFAFTITNSNGTLTLAGGVKTANANTEVCLDVTTKDFQNILSMQYSMKWSPKILEFTRTNAFQLPGTATQNFGTNKSKDGVLTFSWYDQNLRGISLPDGSSIYQVCFNVVGTSGQKGYLKFTGQPTSIEIANGYSELLELNSVAGIVKIR